MSPLKPPRGFTASSPLRKFKVGALGHKKARRVNGEVNKNRHRSRGLRRGRGGGKEREEGRREKCGFEGAE